MGVVAFIRRHKWKLSLLGAGTAVGTSLQPAFHSSYGTVLLTTSHFRSHRHHPPFRSPHRHRTMSVGQFTGDQLMSGYALGRNSSRVLAPPGGKSKYATFPARPPSPEGSLSVATSRRRRSIPLTWLVRCNCSDIFGTFESAQIEPAPAAHAKRNASTVFRSPIRQVCRGSMIIVASVFAIFNHILHTPCL